MSKANLRLHLAFDLELLAPGEALQLDQASLSRQIATLLDDMVLQGTPIIAGKRLGKGGFALLGHHTHLALENLAAPVIPRAQLIAAAPHLTDAELDALARQAAGRQGSPEELARILRRMAMAMVSDFRLLPCEVHAVLSTGKPATLSAQLNLTNGSVLVTGQDRQQRLQAGQPSVLVRVPDTDVCMPAQCSGHTLSGPVLAVALAEIARFHDQLIAMWSSQA